jgi:ribosomal protein S18 acetylase RimI-like enzyme
MNAVPTPGDQQEPEPDTSSGTDATAETGDRPARRVRSSSEVAAPPVVDAWQADLHLLSEVLLRSFFDDPLMMWLCPEEKRRTRALPAFFYADLDSISRRGRVLTTPDRAGAAAWSAPGQWKTPSLETLRVAAMLTRQFGRRIRPGLGLFNLIERQHPEEPHWYLAVIGTDPAKQGRGVGGALINEITAQCDGTGAGAYLESSKEANAAYYERFGFKVRGEISYKDSPTLWRMWRDPQ